MKRTKHSLSHYTLSTFDMGELIPVGSFEVLPGDSVRMATSCLLRVSPLMAPVMHPVQVRIHHWFVPYRVLWSGWESFITGGADGEGDGVGSPPVQLGGTFTAGTLADYFGIPPGVAVPNINAWPWYAYNTIFNEYYRDQDLVSARALLDNSVARVAWEKDYFTAARPWTQKGPDVVVPIGGSAPVIGTGNLQPTFDVDNSVNTPLVSNATAVVSVNAAPTNPGMLEWNDPKLIADLSAATGASINALREAFALQRYQEARAQYGSRYTEYLRYLGVRSSDARLQRPEYLGGGRATIAFSEVLRTGDNGASTRIGELQGHGISALRSRRWIRFFEEHGIVMSLASIRPRTMYVNGIERRHRKVTKEDYWQRELEQIGQQEVLNTEVFGSHASPNGVFGYQDRYAEYRHNPSYVCGDFRTSTMNDWHLGRIFASAPALNSDFVTCVPSKRIHAVQTDDVIWGMFSHSIQARRMVGSKTIGRLF